MSADSERAVLAVALILHRWKLSLSAKPKDSIKMHLPIRRQLPPFSFSQQFLTIAFRSVDAFLLVLFTRHPLFPVISRQNTDSFLIFLNALQCVFVLGTEPCQVAVVLQIRQLYLG